MSFSVLLIDDDELIRRVMERHLVKLGATRIVTASDGDEAMQILHEQDPFDVILLDLMMPGADGIQFLRYMAGRRDAAHLILTSSVDRKLLGLAQSLARAHSLSVLGVLVNPVRIEALGEMIALRDRPGARSTVELPMSIARLEAALDAGLVVPNFQPKICAGTGALHSVEALARWDDAAEGAISPARFIPIADGDDVIDRMTLQLCAQSFAALRSWERQGLRLDLSINLSAHSLNGVDLPDRMLDLAAGSGLDPDRVTFEITETVLIGHLQKSLDTLTRLRLKGFKLSIDDFGTGYSTLTQLKLLPLSELKIDKSFVARATTDDEARVIVEACVRLARQLGLASVAEGVEDEATATFLRELGTSLLQGFLYSRPLPPEQLLEWGQRARAAPSPLDHPALPG